MTRDRLESRGWSEVGEPSTFEALMEGRVVRIALRARGEASLPGSAGLGSATSGTTGASPDSRVIMQRNIDAAIEQLGQSAGSRVVPAEEITISVEVADAPVDILAASFAELDERCKPGLEGLRLTMVAQEGAAPTTWWSFPSQQMIAGDTPARAGVALVSQASGDSALALTGVAGHELVDLAQSRGVRFARFGVTHVAELTPGGEAVVLTRGGVVVSPREVTRDALAALRDKIARAVVAARVRMEPTGLRVRTMVSPALDRVAAESADAGPMQVALLCVALYRTGTSSGTTTATNLLGDLLAAGYNTLPEHDSPVLAASVMLALGEYRATTSEPRPWAVDAANAVSAVLRSAVDPATGAWHPGVPEPARGLVALALVRLATRQNFATAGQPEALALARAATRASYRPDAPGLLVGQMPWLGWAEVELAQHAQPRGAIASAAALRQMRDGLLARQVRFDAIDVLGEDAEGGFLLASRDGAGVLGPTWQSARPLAFLATMVREPALTDEKEKLLQLARVLAGARFLRQLCADEAAMHVAPWVNGINGGLWGVRNATWDQHQSLEASVMTLLALDETIRTIDALSTPAGAPPQAPANPAAESPKTP